MTATLINGGFFGLGAALSVMGVWFLWEAAFRWERWFGLGLCAVGGFLIRISF